jgi:Tol biopolymer transport system component
MRVSLALPALLSLGAVTLVDWRPIHGSQAAPWSVDRPVPAPIVFGEGTISTSDDEMDTALTPDGKSVYFTKNHFGQRLGVILRSDFAGGRWSEPVVAPFSGRFTDYDPFITADGARLFFVSNRPTTGASRKDFDLWYVDKRGASWSEPIRVSDVVNSAQDEFYPTVSADGTLYFSATRPDSLGRSDIYRSRWQNGSYQPPENLGAGVNSAATEVDSYVAPDQSFIVFAGFGRPDDMGNGDLYISEHVNGSWTAARHLGAGINSTAREYCPAASPDGKYFFFTSFRGFGESVPDHPLTYRELRAGLDGVLNGWGNVYQIDMAALRSGRR